jgi:hypothetical protein
MNRLISTLSAVCCACLLLSGCSRGNPNGPVASRPSFTAGLDRPAVLATLPAATAARKDGSPAGLGLHTVPPAEVEYVFSERGGGAAFVTETPDGFQVVHNGRPGRSYAAVGTIALSPDGRHCAHGSLVDGKWRMVVDGLEGEGFAAIRSPEFSPDGSHLAYQAMAGERWHLVVDSTVSSGTATRYLGHEFSADSSRIAFITDAEYDDGDGLAEAHDEEGWGKLVVSDLAFKAEVLVEAHANTLLANEDHSAIAAIGASGGKLRVVSLRFDRPDAARRGAPGDDVSDPVFGPDGDSLAYILERSGQRYLVLDGRESPLPPGDLVGDPVIRPDRKTAGIFMATGGPMPWRQLFLDGRRSGPAQEEAEELVFTGDGRTYAHAARRGAHWFVVVGGQEGPAHDRVVSPAFSPDGKFLVYRARKDGARFVVVADLSGRTIRQHPSYEQVFPVLFTADGKSVAYGVKDGQRLAWKVEPL